LLKKKNNIFLFGGEKTLTLCLNATQLHLGMIEFSTKYYCNGCGKLLLKSAKELMTPVEIVCSRSQCRKKQVVCSAPIPFNEQVAILSKKNNEFCAERERIKKQFHLGKNHAASIR
jgi:hypothetical protein